MRKTPDIDFWPDTHTHVHTLNTYTTHTPRLCPIKKFRGTILAFFHTSREKRNNTCFTLHFKHSAAERGVEH